MLAPICEEQNLHGYLWIAAYLIHLYATENTIVDELY